MPAPRDVNRNPQPYLRPVDGAAQTISPGSGVSARAGTQFNTKTIVIALRVISGEIRYRLGNSGVDALVNDHRLRTTDGQRFVSIDNRDGMDTHIAVWGFGGAAVVEVEEFW